VPGTDDLRRRIEALISWVTMGTDRKSEGFLKTNNFDILFATRKPGRPRKHSMGET